MYSSTAINTSIDDELQTQVLIVEDHAAEQLRIKSMIQKMGYSTHCASNGKEALEMLDTMDIDIIISDWKMPLMDGLELCRQIRSDDRYEYPYFILLTGCDTRPDLIAGMDAGADDFITKPFNNEELRVRLLAGYRIQQLKQQLNSKSTHLEQVNSDLKQTELLMSQDLQTAAHMQQELLPHDYCLVPKWDAASLFRPANCVSGDTFNLFRLGDNTLGFYHIDVSGHGVSAAMMSFTLARLIGAGHGSIDEHLCSIPFNEISPAEIVLQLNQRFQNDQLHTPYFTMIYGVIDCHTGKAKLCQAGHPHPFIIRQSGEIIKLGEGGFPVGCIDDADYHNCNFYLNKNDRLIIYSDGITECHNSNNDILGEARLMGLLRNTQSKSLHEIVESIETAIHRWGRSSHTEDDISALIIEHN